MKTKLFIIAMGLSFCIASGQNWTNVSQNFGLTNVVSTVYYPGIGYVVACETGIYKYDNNLFFGLPLIQSNNIRRMQKFDSKLYFSTSSGLYIWEQGAPTEHLTVNNGLMSNDVYGVAVSGSNRLIIQKNWVSYYDGVNYQHYSFHLIGGFLHKGVACNVNNFGAFYLSYGNNLIMMDGVNVDTLHIFDQTVTDLTINPVTNQLLILTKNSIVRKHFNQYSQLYPMPQFPYTGYFLHFCYVQQTNSIVFVDKTMGFQALYSLNLNNYELRYGGLVPSEIREIYVLNSKVFLSASDGLYMNDLSIFDNQFVEIIDHGNFKALFTESGRLFWDGNDRSLIYPKLHLNFPGDEQKMTVFAAQLWMGAFNQMNQLCVAAERFSQIGNDFFAGPVSDVYDSQYDEQFSSLWKLYRSEITNHSASYQLPTYVMPNNILKWPTAGNVALGQAPYLAPYFDHNQNGIYDPANGDFPIIPGEQAVYMIFNDDRYDHTESSGVKMGIETHAIAYVISVNNDTVFDDVLFVKYNLFNRRNNDFTQMYVGHWSDIDLGYAWDDFIGCDTSLHCFYGYNGRLIDGVDSNSYYLKAPPVQGVTFLNNNMTSFMTHNNGGHPDYDDPHIAFEYYNQLQGLFNDGTSMINPLTGQQTTYSLPGNPMDSTQWSEVTSLNDPFDRRGIGSIGPLTFPSGSSFCFDIAYVYNRDCTDTINCDNFSNIPGFLAKTAHVRDVFAASAYPCPITSVTLTVSPVPPYTAYQAAAAYVYNDQLDYHAAIDDVILTSASNIGNDKVLTNWLIVQGSKGNIEIKDVVFNVPGNSRALLYLNLHHNPDNRRMETFTFKYFTWGLTGLDENFSPIISIHPNPAEDNLFVTLDTHTQLPVEMTLYDMRGLTVFTHKMMKTDEVIDVSQVPSGLYVLSVRDAVGNENKMKLVVQ